MTGKIIDFNQRREQAEQRETEETAQLSFRLMVYTRPDGTYCGYEIDIDMLDLGAMRAAAENLRRVSNSIAHDAYAEDQDDAHMPWMDLTLMRNGDRRIVIPNGKGCDNAERAGIAGWTLSQLHLFEKDLRDYIEELENPPRDTD